MNASIVWTYAVIQTGKRTFVVGSACWSVDGVYTFTVDKDSPKFATEQQAQFYISTLRKS